jgi:hypothetical protein
MLSRSAIRRGLALFVALVLGLAWPSAALAKGPSRDAVSSSATATTTTSPNSASSVGAAAAANPNNPLSAFPQPQVSTQPQTQPVAPVTTTSSRGSSSLSGNSALVIAIGALVVLGAISFFIWRDARRRAPVTSGAGGFDVRRSGSKAPPKSRKLSAAERRRRKRGRARR